ncbi:hypothetical protein Tco_1303540 [Tanacetum coccineum]
MRHGFDLGYKTWVHHGEPDLPSPPPVIDNTRQSQMSDMTALLNDLSYIPPNNEHNEPTQGYIGETSNEPTQATRNEFEELYASANEESRLSRMDDDLFTYEVEIDNMDDDSEHEADNDMGYDPSDVAFTEWNDGLSITDARSSKNLDEVTEFLTLRDSKPLKITRMIGSMNGTRTYHSWMNYGYCNRGNLPGTYIIGNQCHYQDYEWYEALEDGELKNEALRNKAIMEGLINEGPRERNIDGVGRMHIF